MSRPQSRTGRKAAFLKEAERMYEQLEDWYDKHPEASFGEIEAEARKRRRELMGRHWASREWTGCRGTSRSAQV